MSKTFSTADLEAYLDESLASDVMAEIEKAVRGDRTLVAQLETIRDRRDAGLHSLGEIWRRRRVTCFSREELGSFLLEVLPDDQARYIAFHLDEIGCRYCQANLADLKSLEAGTSHEREARRRRYFQSSAGYL